MLKDRHMKYVAYCIGALLLASMAEAQTNWSLEKSRNAFFLSSSVFGSDNGKGVGVSAGYSIASILELGVGFSHDSLDEKEFGLDGIGDIGLNSLSASVSVSPIQHTEEQPLAFSLSAGFLNSAFSNDAFDEADIELTSTTWRLGGTVFAVLPASPTMDIIPYGNMSYYSTELEVNGQFNQSASVNDDEIGFGGGFAIAVVASPRNRLYIAPGFTRINKVTIFSLTVVLSIESENPGNHGWSRPVSRPPPRDYPRQPTRQPPSTPPPTRPAPRADTTPSGDIFDPQFTPLGTIAAADLEPLVAMLKALPYYDQIAADSITPEERSLLSRVFKVTPEDLRSMSWGQSLAPQGHPLANAVWCTVKYSAGDYQATETITFNREGGILKRDKK